MKTIFCTNEEILNRVRELNPYSNIKYKQTDDITNGLLFADVFGEVARYNVTAKAWYVYDGIIWKEDTGEMIVEGLAHTFARAMYVYSVDADPNYQKYVQKLGNRHNRNTMLLDARNYHFISADMLDSQGDLLNLRNVVLNLRTFEVLEHDSKYLLSKVANVEYRPEIRSEDFESFIDQIFLSDEDKIRYVQKLHGYALTSGNDREECYIYYGATTRNGKSTLLETYSFMLGDYSLNMQPESLAQVKRDSRTASGDIARLAGCRFLHVSEPPKRMIFDVALLKTLLGRDKITARHLQQREFEFVPEFKLILNTNCLPIVNDDTLFSSGRVKVVPFERHFDEKEQDQSLKDRLKEEENLSGLLNWCLEGLKRYYEEGLTPPDCVRDATKSYREESDKLKQFIEDCLVEDPHSILEGRILYQNYAGWCRANGYGCENKKNFFEELKAKKLLSPSGTICGKTVRNVVRGYRIDVGMIDSGFVKAPAEFDF